MHPYMPACEVLFGDKPAHIFEPSVKAPNGVNGVLHRVLGFVDVLISIYSGFDGVGVSKLCSKPYMIFNPEPLNPKPPRP